MSLSTTRYTQVLTQLLTERIGQLPAMTRPLAQSVGWRLASDVVTTSPSPRFDNSQMDGYGIGYANVAGGRFRVGPDVPAGTDPSEIYHYGVNGYGHDTAVPIMTGAQIPEDVVAIVPVEHADPPKFVATGEYVRLPAVEVGAFIRRAGSDMRSGTLIARAGETVDAALVAAAASQGLIELPVKARPRIAVVAGGDEVVGGETPVAAKIFDANTPLVAALGATHGMNIVATASTTDDLRDFRGVLDALIRDHSPDIILTSGGISEGKYEVVRQLFERLDEAWVGKVNQQPGGPQGYGVYGTTPIIGLPGNPISTLVSVRMLVLPALWQAFGAGYEPVEVTARINHAVTGIRGKTQYRRGVVGVHGAEVVAQVQGDAGSHLLAQAVGANALLEIPPMARLQPGHSVTAHLFADTTFNTPVHPVPHKVSPPKAAQRTENHPETRTGTVVIASTRAATGVYDDDVGPKLVEWLTDKGYSTPAPLIVTDQDMEDTLQRLTAGEYGPMPDVLITSGGTGISPTDQTVEVVSKRLDQQLPHVMTAILLEGLQNTPHAALSRGVAGLIEKTFVVTLPGSPGGVADGMKVLDEIIDHIVEQVRGEDHKR
ncbi:MAG TPA: molybdopterin-binding protein [Yaniella sp.]